ncbi:MAG: ATP-binding cassette domain-containing protein [Anaerolineales bacterium]|jgi:ABC-2 type transport system ATP-binding protein
MIEVEKLSRLFGGVTAVDGISFEVESGEIFGFVGPNGAGKSTTINMLCTLLKPSGGRARIDGQDIVVRRDGIRQSIGLVFQDPTLDERLTARQNLQFTARLYDLPGKVVEARSKELLEMVALSEQIDRPVKTFSGGMKRRLEIVLGLLHHPKVLFLDEPTIGLDPQTRRQIWDYVVHMRAAEGLTVFLTTHYMDETEICDLIAIIDYGRIVACDTPDRLKASIGGDVVTLRTGDDAVAAAVLQGRGLDVERNGDGVRVRVERGDEFIPQAVRLLDADGRTAVRGVSLKRPTLDDVFLQLTGRAIRDEGAGADEQMRSRRMQHRRRQA